MPIQDSSPERRNLTVTAFSIILFYIAGAEFEKQEIRLQIINVHFTNTSILIVTVWGLLFWFAFRYWQKFRGLLFRAFNSFVQHYRSQVVCNWYLYIAHKIKRPLEQDFLICTLFEKKDEHWVLSYQYFKKASFDLDGKLCSSVALSEVDFDKRKFVILNVFSKLFIYPYIFVKAFVFDAEIGSILVPYLLFLVAITFGLCSIG